VIVVGVSGEVALGRDDELGEVGVADDASEPSFGSEHAGGRPPERHVAGLPVLDVAAGAPDALDRLHGLVL
jgi:hypothetical protein